jgi:hypothetical protein
MDEACQGIVLSSPPKCGVPVARVGLIDEWHKLKRNAESCLDLRIPGFQLLGPNSEGLSLKPFCFPASSSTMT